MVVTGVLEAGGPDDGSLVRGTDGGRGGCDVGSSDGGGAAGVTAAGVTAAGGTVVAACWAVAAPFLNRVAAIKTTSPRPITNPSLASRGMSAPTTALGRSGWVRPISANSIMTAAAGTRHFSRET